VERAITSDVRSNTLLKSGMASPADIGNQRAALRE
jgi:hypothetical protein